MPVKVQNVNKQQLLHCYIRVSYLNNLVVTSCCPLLIIQCLTVA